MKIVVISRCIYPAIAPRPFRATELAKYFAKQGHEVYLYAVLGKYNYREFEEATGVHVCSLGKMHFATLNSDGYARKNALDRFLKRLLGKCLEFPDIELMWKTKKVVSQLRNVDMLVTVAIPYPIHWGAALAKKKSPQTFPRVWVSDCGDPYMGNSVGKTHPSYFQKIEDFWGRQTNYITVPIEEARKAYSENVQDKIRVIPQGFDFSNTRIDRDFKENSVVRFAYAGAIYRGYRDPTRFLQLLCELKQLPFEFVVYTKSQSLFEPYKTVLGDKLIIKNYIPREELLWELSRMDFLINIKNESTVQSPSKLIDYYLTERPILDITTEFHESDIVEEFLERNYSHQHIKADISQYDINNVGKRFLNLTVDTK